MKPMNVKYIFGNDCEYADQDACVAALTAAGVEDPISACAELQTATESG